MHDGSYYQFWVYILTSPLYIGVTGYLGSRIMQHKIDSFEALPKSTRSIGSFTTRATST